MLFTACCASVISDSNTYTFRVESLRSKSSSISLRVTGAVEITLVNGQKFTKYEFREDEAEYKETISLSNHSPIVTHELTFMLDKMGYEASASVESMLNTTLGGLVALVRTTNDEIFLVGYSLPFEKERPLRIASVTATTGKQLRDETTETITLRSIDTNMALPFERRIADGSRDDGRGLGRIARRGSGFPERRDLGSQI